MRSRSSTRLMYVVMVSERAPGREALIAARGANSNYHNNCITIWKINPDGGVVNV